MLLQNSLHLFKKRLASAAIHRARSDSDLRHPWCHQLLSPEVAFSQIGCRVIIGAGLVVALSQNEQQTIVVVQRAYRLTAAAVRGLATVGQDLARTSGGSWIVTNLSRASVDAGSAALDSVRSVLTKAAVPSIITIIASQSVYCHLSP